MMSFEILIMRDKMMTKNSVLLYYLNLPHLTRMNTKNYYASWHDNHTIDKLEVDEHQFQKLLNIALYGSDFKLILV